LTCLFLSCKAEDHYQDLSYFLAKIKEFSRADIKSEDIIKLELVVLQGLQFHLLVYHPYRSLHAFVNDKELTSQLNTPGDKLYSAGIEGVKATLLTDASFLYPPGLIALAALYNRTPHAEDQAAIMSYVYLTIITNNEQICPQEIWT
jgi:cyclin H